MLKPWIAFTLLGAMTADSLWQVAHGSSALNHGLGLTCIWAMFGWWTAGRYLPRWWFMHKLFPRWIHQIPERAPITPKPRASVWMHTIAIFIAVLTVTYSAISQTLTL